MYRIGATSYVIPDHILPNVEYLAPLVDDVELVLFETDEHGSNLPDRETRDRLAELAAAHALTYTVHLPLDVLPGAAEGSECLVKAARVVDATRDLAPVAYSLHLDGRPFIGGPDGASPEAGRLASWREGAIRSLMRIAEWVGDPRMLCVENLEAWDPELFAPILDEIPVSRTADVGHLWLRGEEALPALQAWLPRTRVVHLHGIAARDHASLAHIRSELLDPVVELLERLFSGVVTLEVFTAADLQSSMETVENARRRLGMGGLHG